MEMNSEMKGLNLVGFLLSQITFPVVFDSPEKMSSSNETKQKT